MPRYRFRRAIAAWTCVSAPVAIALGCFLLVIGLFQQPWLGATIGVVLASAEFALSFRRVRRRTVTVTAEGLEVQRDKYRLLVPWPAIAKVQRRRHQLVVAVDELVVTGADVVPARLSRPVHEPGHHVPRGTSGRRQGHGQPLRQAVAARAHRRAPAPRRRTPAGVERDACPASSWQIRGRTQRGGARTGSSVGGVNDTELVGVQKTLSPVLRAKALDNRLPDPILGDTYAEQAMRRLDPGYSDRRFGSSQMGLAAVVRAKAHDDWARSFLADHPDAVVLHLGCGLDARVYPDRPARHRRLVRPGLPRRHRTAATAPAAA